MFQSMWKYKSKCAHRYVDYRIRLILCVYALIMFDWRETPPSYTYPFAYKSFIDICKEVEGEIKYLIYKLCISIQIRLSCGFLLSLIINYKSICIYFPQHHTNQFRFVCWKNLASSWICINVCVCRVYKIKKKLNQANKIVMVNTINL